MVPITTMSGPAIKVDPNANTNQPAQSAVSVSGSNSLTNQQTGNLQNTIQSQINGPTQTGAPVPLEVTTLGDASKGLDQIAKQSEYYEPVGFKPSTNGPAGSVEAIVVKHDAVGYDPIPSVNPSSPFKSVSVTNPNEPWNNNGWNGQSVQNPLDSQYNQNNQVMHIEPSALVRQTQGLDQNADNDPTGTESLHIKDWNVPFFEMSESPNQITPGKLIWEQ